MKDERKKAEARLGGGLHAAPHQHLRGGAPPPFQNVKKAWQISVSQDRPEIIKPKKSYFQKLYSTIVSLKKNIFIFLNSQG